ncbi:MAG: DUF1778 domain-containing protein [Spiribacter salinus]|uniref:DUF1778 domain-containing protein n=1 Tax=Spiribacter salinus TaxID=1335746 RepID=A0A540VFA8_9GAMM|nr:MAG: DUF1778 domain-containing protein [Spiribacter salinus]
MEQKNKVIHCRVTPAEHAAISMAAKDSGVSITQFVVRAALAKTPEPAD